MALGFFLAATVGAGSLVGIVTKPAYVTNGLALPWYFPPAWLLAPFFLIFHVASASVAWRIWLVDDPRKRSGLLLSWTLQLGLNLFWSPTFFIWRLHLIALPMVVAAFGIAIFQLRWLGRYDRPAVPVLRFCLLCTGYVLCLSAATLYLNF